MKNILHSTMPILGLLFFSIIPAYADVCSIPEGTYVGKTIVQFGQETEKWPFFIVAANKRITGFYAPTDQTHPQGASINQAELNTGFTFFITTTSKGDFLNLKSEGLEFPTGKAKKINAMGGSAFSGYYLVSSSEEESEHRGDFINIGKDGGLIARITASRNFNVFFGKVNTDGEFVQIFPGDGPKLSFESFGDSLVADVTDDNGKHSFEFNINSSESCVSGSISSEGGLANELLIQGFKQNLSDVNNAFSGLLEAIGESKFLKENGKPLSGSLEKANTLLNEKNDKSIKDKDCKQGLVYVVKIIDKVIEAIERKYCSVYKGPKCFPDDVALSFVSKMKSSLGLAKQGLDIDDDENAIPDICE